MKGTSTRAAITAVPHASRMATLAADGLRLSVRLSSVSICPGSLRAGDSLSYTSFPDHHGATSPLVKEMEWLNVAIRRIPTPTVLVPAWVKEIRRLCGRIGVAGRISFTIRTSRMGSVTTLGSVASRSILFTIRARRSGLECCV